MAMVVMMMATCKWTSSGTLAPLLRIGVFLFGNRRSGFVPSGMEKSFLLLLLLEKWELEGELEGELERGWWVCCRRSCWRRDLVMVIGKVKMKMVEG